MQGKNKLTRQKISFLDNPATWNDARAVVMGIPLDSASSYRAGSRFAPEEIRTVFEVLEDYSLQLEASLAEAYIYDLGDMHITGDGVWRNLNRAEKLIAGVVNQNKIPVLIGGDHSITYAPVSALLSNGYEDLVVLQFDAHLDLRPSYLEEKYSHASVIYRLLERGVKDIYQMGIRSATVQELELARAKTNYSPRRVFAPLKKILADIEQKPVYITLDIDVVDPGFAPGTGTPEPGGISSASLYRLFNYFKKLHIVGFDLVEVNPAYDHSRITSILAAKIIREALIILGSK